jgi:glycine hydroxymethyltransferase
MLIDLRNKNVTGKEAQEALDLAGVTVNKNAVPFDDKSPLITSGIRIGTPAITTRGMKKLQMGIVAEFIDRVIVSRTNSTVLTQVSNEVKNLCTSFPLYSDLMSS